MSESRKWWRWPEDKRKNAMAPWFVVIWRLLFWPMLAVGVALAVTATWLMYGPQSARQFWGNL